MSIDITFLARVARGYDTSTGSALLSERIQTVPGGDHPSPAGDHSGRNAAASANAAATGTPIRSLNTAPREGGRA